MTNIPLTLENFTFDATHLEVPEALGGMGGATSIAQHDFPGGVRTHQVFGQFPEPVKWRAHFSGNSALERCEYVRGMLGAAQEQLLTWADRTLAGRLVRFSPVARSLWLFEYECEFWVRKDLTNAQSLAAFSSASQASALEAVLAMQIDSLQALITTAVSAPANLISLFPLVAAELLGPITTVVSAVQLALLNAGGIVTEIADADEQNCLAACLAALAVAQPMMLSTDPTISSPSADVAAYITSLQNIIATAAPAPGWTLNVINPNLYRLAAMYLGDASQWRAIATLNGLTDPQPIGSFTALQIPLP